MGSVISAVGSVFGGSGAEDAATQAGRQARKGQQRGIDALQQQFGFTSQNLQPFVDFGTQQLGALQGGQTAGGLDARLADIFATNSFQALRDERELAVQGQLGAGGLTRSGSALQQISNVPTELGFALESLLRGREESGANLGLGAIGTLGGFGAQNAANVANLEAGIGQSQASGTIAAQQASSQHTQDLFNIFSVGAEEASSAASLFAAFSDPRLKENIEQVSQIQDLGVYQWDWIPEVKNSIVDRCGNLGFMADEVEAKYPHHVGEFGDFKVINYGALLSELETKCLH